MKRWKRKTAEFEEIPEIDAFLEDIERVCKKHKLSIAHEDTYGSFTIENYQASCMDWLKEASDHRL